MSVLIQENNANFTKIANSLIIDKNLSNGAKVLYCYLRSKPNKWKIINSDIENSLNISQDTIAKYFKELIGNDWIQRQKEKDEKGQYAGGYNYILFDLPKKSESGKSPDSEKTRIRKNAGNNSNTKTTINTKTTNKTYFIPPTADQINNYCKEIGVTIDANYFIDWYEARDWYISGKTKMKSWEATVRYWARKDGQVILTAKEKKEREKKRLVEQKKREEEPTTKFVPKKLTAEEEKELQKLMKGVEE